TGLANFYSKHGYSVYIICLFKTQQFFRLEVEIEVTWPKVVRNRIPKFLYAFSTIFYLNKNINRIRPDVILSFGEWINSFVIFSTVLKRVPICAFELMGPNLYLGPLIESFRKITYGRAQCVIVQTIRAADILRSKVKL